MNNIEEKEIYEYGGSYGYIEKEERSWIINLRFYLKKLESSIIIEPTDSKWISKGCYEHFCACKLNNLDEIDQFI